jgi:hypothetical protein
MITAGVPAHRHRLKSTSVFSVSAHLRSELLAQPTSPTRPSSGDSQVILPPIPPASALSAQRAIAASALSRLTQADPRLCLAPQAVGPVWPLPPPRPSYRLPLRRVHLARCRRVLRGRRLSVHRRRVHRLLRPHPRACPVSRSASPVDLPLPHGAAAERRGWAGAHSARAGAGMARIRARAGVGHWVAVHGPRCTDPALLWQLVARSPAARSPIARTLSLATPLLRVPVAWCLRAACVSGIPRAGGTPGSALICTYQPAILD